MRDRDEIETALQRREKKRGAWVSAAKVALANQRRRG